jgi:hypothetical protein
VWHLLKNFDGHMVFGRKARDSNDLSANGLEIGEGSPDSRAGADHIIDDRNTFALTAEYSAFGSRYSTGYNPCRDVFAKRSA